MNIKGAQSYRAWLHNRPRQHVLLLLLRGALRTLPNLRLVLARPGLDVLGPVPPIVLATFRAAAATWLAYRDPVLGRVLLPATQQALSSLPPAVRRLSPPADASASSLYAAASLIRAAAGTDPLPAVLAPDDFAGPTFCANEIIRSLLHAAKASDIWASFAADGNSPTGPAFSDPLWGSPGRLKDRMRAEWAAFKGALATEPDAWGLWVSWYQCVLDGRPLTWAISPVQLPPSDAAGEEANSEEKLALVDRVIAEILAMSSGPGEGRERPLQDHSLPRNAGGTDQPRRAPVRVSREAVIANSTELAFDIAVLRGLIERRIDDLGTRVDRANDPDHLAAGTREIDRLKELLARLEILEQHLEALAKGTLGEAEAAEKAAGFLSQVGQWWNERHPAILDQVADGAIRAVTAATTVALSASVGWLAGVPAVAIGAGATIVTAKTWAETHKPQRSRGGDKGRLRTSRRPS